MGRVFTGLRAPSTWGTYLRSFTHGHVQQLDAISTRVLAGLTTQVAGLIAGAENPEGVASIDVDDTIREVHGYAKQGAADGYTKVCGLNAQLAISDPRPGRLGLLRTRVRWHRATTWGLVQRDRPDDRDREGRDHQHR